ncbi:hypothetical protein BD560DRAFT_382416 [Blakeslea trispora]|nr:hypothetical protein BD560DRAFT_382416 [Blakeslea trispora]
MYSSTTIDILSHTNDDLAATVGQVTCSSNTKFTNGGRSCQDDNDRSCIVIIRLNTMVTTNGLQGHHANAKSTILY